MSTQVTLTIQQQNGSPAPGAKIEGDCSGQADANGRFSFTGPASGTLHYKSAWVDAQGVIWGGQSQVTMMDGYSVSDTCTLSGKLFGFVVTNLNAAGLWVFGWQYRSVLTQQPIWRQVQSGSDGTATLVGFDPLTPVEAMAIFPPNGQSFQEVQLTMDGTPQVMLPFPSTMGTNGSIAVNVQYDAAPIQGAQVNVSCGGWSGSGTTDANGNCTISGLHVGADPSAPTYWNVAVTADQYVSQTQNASLDVTHSNASLSFDMQHR